MIQANSPRLPTPSAAGASRTPLARVLAFYLPQFHPIPENDLWWGPGFTEWTNVTRARPLFPGHVQPRLPADLGFYDLRVPEVREQQAELARQAGVEAFCYWHYWFGDGGRLLERPFAEVLASKRPDFPFCLAWANQSWTGIWHGAPDRTLIEQRYPGRADEAAHFRWAQRAFEDPRYSHVEGKPIFVVFAPHDLPSATGFVEHWRELAHRAGFPGLYLIGVSDRYDAYTDPYRTQALEPFDAVTLLGPQDYLVRYAIHQRPSFRRRVRELNLGPLNRWKPACWRRPTRIEFSDVVRRALEDMPQGERFLPSVLSGWDNTPRSSTRGLVYDGFSPELFKAYLQKALDTVRERPMAQRIILLKAWNEWAEGNMVEPDALYGHALLQSIHEVVLPDSRSPQGAGLQVAHMSGVADSPQVGACA